MRVRAFDVDEPIPTLTIPLTAGDALSFDFGVPYRKTFDEALFGLELVDYGQLPVNFNRYSKTDQTRIAARMLAVLEAARAGVDLETGPFPVKAVTLEAALTEIEALRTEA
ncbi:MAG: hypothetical protein R3E79_52950 [Caldilineaceae bacterium]